ncbi:MAG: contractile injection system protein, VgrG/Pvc8 family [Pseudobdellovibrionaceae bacterium]|nr:contractile injection system protein, VgrG/Pvc8 family [Pseudobdellovibrionaceae bacterium]
MFRITADGKDLTDRIRQRLVNLTVKDGSGLESDCIQLHLFDDPPLDPPREGTRIEIALGYNGHLFDVGRYASRPISLKGPPAIVTVEASVLDCFPTLLEPKKRSWRPDTLTSVISRLAKENGLIPSVDKSCDLIQIPHEDQTESDSAFLARIADHYECIYKVQRDHLIFYDRASKVTPSGSSIRPEKIKGIVDYEFKYSREQIYSGVKASWWGHGATKHRTVLAGKEGKVFVLKFLLKDEASARDAAEAKLRKLKRLSTNLTFSIPGNPLLFSGGRCLIEKVHPLLNREWVIASVEHTLDNNGFISKVTAEGNASL